MGFLTKFYTLRSNDIDALPICCCRAFANFEIFINGYLMWLRFNIFYDGKLRQLQTSVELFNAQDVSMHNYIFNNEIDLLIITLTIRSKVYDR